MVMLWRKLLRDLRENWGVNLACVLVIALGIMSFNAFRMAVDNLETARDKFYQSCRFADGFATVKQMPAERLSRLEEIPGIDQVQGHLRQDVTVYMPEWGQNLTLRMVAFEPGDAMGLNQVLQSQGPGVAEGSDEILLGVGFAKAHGLQAGDSLDIIYQGQKHSLTMAGTGQSPEFIYLVPDSGAMFSDAARFDVAFMDREALEDLTGHKGLVNEVAFTLRPGVDFDQVKNQVEEILSPYDLYSLVSAEDQISNFMLAQEIKGVNATSNSIPAIFIAIAAFILYLMLRRMVEQQRVQIGTMKAVGYGNAQIIIHYSLYGAFIGVSGAVLGSLTGILVSGAMTEMYKLYFNLPDLINRVSFRYGLLSLAFAAIPCFGAAFLGARSVLRLEPSQAMQPATPKRTRRLLIERVKAVWEPLGMMGRMALRNLFRNPGRSLFTLLGTSLAFALMWFIFSYNLLIDLMIMNQLEMAQRYDFKVTLAQPAPARELADSLMRLEGADTAEPMMYAAVTLRQGPYSEETSITGLPEHSELYKILDKGEKIMALPPEGLVLSKSLADKLHTKAGQLIYLESPYLSEPVQIYVTEVVEQYFGMENFMPLERLGQLLGIGDSASAAMIRTSGDRGTVDRLEEKLLLAKGVAGVENKSAMKKMYEDLMAPMNSIIFSMTLVGVFTAFAVIYSTGTVSLSERQREISSSKVLGMTDGEIMTLLIMENGILSLLGGLLGVPLTKAMMLMMQRQFATELYSLPARLDPVGLVYSLVSLGVALVLSMLAMMRRVRRLDLVVVLKTRE
jgi:putative ABC transport system permease protein